MQYKIKELTEFSDTTTYILWEDGHESIYLYEDLRQLCPCASCDKLRKSSKTGRLPFKRKIPVGTEETSIRPLKIENVGHYAVKFYWNDRHDTGIYTFDYLRDNCSCEICSDKS
ncbi:MAG: DUF971 domain-containing protein [Thermodesulfobacteriota bacterium]